jgi:hypothetical protein
METHHTFCRICEALCGLEGARRDRRRSVRARSAAIHGPDSIAMYVGTAAGFGVLHPIFAQGFMTGLGSKQHVRLGHPGLRQQVRRRPPRLRLPVHSSRSPISTHRLPDHRRREPGRLEVELPAGAQPLPAPARAAARGAKVWSSTRAAPRPPSSAGEHVFIRPDTDVFFYLSFLHELLAAGRHRPSRPVAATPPASTSSPLARALAPSAPPPSPAIPRGPARAGRRLRTPTARRSTPRPASTWAPMARSASGSRRRSTPLSGNLDRRGRHAGRPGHRRLPRLRQEARRAAAEPTSSRVGDFAHGQRRLPRRHPRRRDPHPRRGPGARALRHRRQPADHDGQRGRLRRRFEQLELLVTLDIFRNETGSLATTCCRAPAPLERPDLPFIFPLMLGLQAKPYLQATRADLSPDGEQRDEATIYLDLCRASGCRCSARRCAARPRG